jgi:hypothetical protein
MFTRSLAFYIFGGIVMVTFVRIKLRCLKANCHIQKLWTYRVCTYLQLEGFQ